jgi:L-alanine-DL-glutamate epimerase-like enolase superfamily enzyme
VTRETPSRVAFVTATPIDLELTEPFAIARGAATSARNVIVSVALEDGTVGLGEAAPFTAVSGETQEGTLAAVQGAASVLVGSDARAHLRIAAELAELCPDAPAARCALEMAVLDAVTRQQRTPLWLHFGGAGSALETDLTITAGDAAHASHAAKRAWERGITVLKLKVGALSGQSDAERLRAVHEAAPNARLIADANGGFSVAEASRFLHDVRRMRLPLELLEQPVDPGDWLELARSLPETSVLLCADESARSASDLIALVRANAVGAVNLKPMKTGIAEALAMWHVARASGVRLMIGGMVESVLAMSFSAHFAAGLGGFDYVDLDTPMFIATHPFQGGFVQDRARLDVSAVPSGHGVTWARDAEPRAGQTLNVR